MEAAKARARSMDDKEIRARCGREVPMGPPICMSAAWHELYRPIRTDPTEPCTEPPTEPLENVTEPCHPLETKKNIL